MGVFNTRNSHECSQDEVAEITTYLLSKFPAIKRLIIVVEEPEHDEEPIVSGALAMEDIDRTAALETLLLKAIEHVRSGVTAEGIANRITGEVLLTKTPRGN